MTTGGRSSTLRVDDHRPLERAVLVALVHWPDVNDEGTTTLLDRPGVGGDPVHTRACLRQDLVQ